MPSNIDSTEVMGADMIGNALMWLLSKLVNYFASGDSIDHVFPQNRASAAGFIGINQMILLERWRELEKELRIWHEGLPATFKPCARLEAVATPGRGLGVVSQSHTFPEIWYSMPICAAAMATYHMARILLLINKPHESTVRRTTVASRLQSYRTIEAEVRHHSREICGIALGHPDAAVRVHMSQPLYVAGQCMTEPAERMAVVDLLRSIETDLGWATDYRVRRLMDEWSPSE